MVWLVPAGFLQGQFVLDGASGGLLIRSLGFGGRRQI